MNTWLKIPPSREGLKLTVREIDPRQELNRLHNEFVSILTSQQQRLLAAGALTAAMCTPHQQEMLLKMAPYLEGLTTEQITRLALYDQRLANQEEFNRGWQAGWESGESEVSFIKIAVIGGLVLMILASLVSIL